MSNTPAKIKINKSIYTVIGFTKDAEDSKGYTSYELLKGTKVKKTLVHHRESNEFTLWGGKGLHRTMTFPNHIELVN